MEKIIFFALVIPIIGFVLYLGANAIMKGFSAKETNRSEKDEVTLKDDFSSDKEQLSNELSKLNELLQSGALTQEEFQIVSLKKILQELKVIAEQETLNRISKRIQINEEIKQKVTLANKHVKNDMRLKKAELLNNLFDFLPESKKLELLGKTDLYTLLIHS